MFLYVKVCTLVQFFHEKWTSMMLHLEGNQKYEHMYKNLFLKLFLLFDYVLILDEPFEVFVVWTAFLSLSK